MRQRTLPVRWHRATTLWLPGFALLVAACAPAPPAPTPSSNVPTHTVRTSAAPAMSREPTATPRRTTPASPDPSPQVGAAWERLPEAPVALTEVAAVAHAGRLWVVGGLLADGSASSSVFSVDAVEARWFETAPLPRPIHHAALVSFEERLYVLGGFVGPAFDSPTAEVWLLGDDGEWEAAPPLPEPRGAGAAAWDGARIVFAGGVGPNGVTGDVYALSGGAWQRIGQLGEARQHLAAASDARGRVWFLGGRHSGLETNVGTVEVVTTTGVEGVPTALTPRSGVGAFWIAGIGACLIGGETPEGTSSLVECVADGGQIVGLPPLAVARHGLGVAVLSDGVYAVMGGEQPGLFVSATAERLPIRSTAADAR